MSWDKNKKELIKSDGIGYSMQSIKATLLPCPYFGSIEYFYNLISNEYLIELNDYFVKQSLRTRCKIYGANGILTLTVPKSRKQFKNTIQRH